DRSVWQVVRELAQRLVVSPFMLAWRLCDRFPTRVHLLRVVIDSGRTPLCGDLQGVGCNAAKHWRKNIESANRLLEARFLLDDLVASGWAERGRGRQEQTTYLVWRQPARSTRRPVVCLILCRRGVPQNETQGGNGTGVGDEANSEDPPIVFHF